MQHNQCMHKKYQQKVCWIVNTSMLNKPVMLKLQDRCFAQFEAGGRGKQRHCGGEGYGGVQEFAQQNAAPAAVRSLERQAVDARTEDRR